jgi:hypothetical protein
MELYMRFLVSLAAGLLGVGMVLKVLLDGLFNEWDAVADMGDLFRNGLRLKQSSAGRAEDVMLELEKANAVVLTTSIYEQKRQELQELSAVETRLNRAGGPVRLTPVAPPSAEPAATWD